MILESQEYVLVLFIVFVINSRIVLIIIHVTWIMSQKARPCMTLCALMIWTRGQHAQPESKLTLQFQHSSRYQDRALYCTWVLEYLACPITSIWDEFRSFACGSHSLHSQKSRFLNCHACVTSSRRDDCPSRPRDSSRLHYVYESTIVLLL